MATTPKPETPPGSVEEAATRIRELNERLIETSKAAGNTTLDAYEKALTSLVDFEEKIAGASQLEGVTALAQTHAAFVRDVSTAYTQAARDLLG
jgi:predicted RNA-binding Zn ribbon-like protein